LAEIIPFRAWRYNFARAGRPEEVLAPPFDIISPDEAAALRESHEHNIVHLVLGSLPAGGARPEGAYRQAAEKLRRWQQSGVLVRDEKPAIYPYEQEFVGPDGQRRTRFGFVCALRLVPFGQRVVYPHEETFDKPVDDRVSLMRACRANLSMVFAIFRDEARVAERALAAAIARGAEKLFEFTDANGVVHRMFRVDDEETIRTVAQRLAPRPLIIADGHHRYSACLRLAEELRQSAGGRRGPWDYCTVYLCNMVDRGMTIYPTHRLLRCASDVDWGRLARYFELRELPSPTPQAIVEHLRDLAARRAVGFVIHTKEKTCAARLRRFDDVAPLIEPDRPEYWRRLGYVVLHAVVIRSILGVDDRHASGQALAYTPEVGEALARVASGEFHVALLVNPPTLQDLQNVCLAGARMPHKATYFYPKVLSGAVIRSLEEF